MIGKIGIRKENKDITEKRAPLTPDQVKELIDKYSLQVVVEPADNRIFKNEEYQQAGAQISNNLKYLVLKKFPFQTLFQETPIAFSPIPLKANLTTCPC